MNKNCAAAADRVLSRSDWETGKERGGERADGVQKGKMHTEEMGIEVVNDSESFKGI